MEQTQTNQAAPPPTPPGYTAQPVQQTTQEVVEKNDKNLYSVSFASIVARNFFAGFARAMGTIIVYVAFIIFTGYLFKAYVMPELEPLFGAFESISTLQEMTQPNADSQSIQIDQETVNSIMQQFQSGNEQAPVESQ